MAGTTGMEEKRKHPRHALKKKVVARMDDDDIDALLSDVSAGGASLDGGFEFDDNAILEIDIEDVGVFSAEVTRSFDDGIGVRFTDIDENEEEQLLSDLAELDSSIRFDEI
ncbi:MAG: PilZ domain-containing protein [Rhodospirillales bacterium]|nr:PilZ domain-containing protein [Rhodospirillales bacterium]